MKHSHSKPNRLEGWGDSLVNKLPGRSRKQRKRQVSKKRRALLKAENDGEDIA
jgi:hypothetical protein